MSSVGTDWVVPEDVPEDVPERPEDVPEHWSASHVLCTLCVEVLLNGPLKPESTEELMRMLGAGKIWERAVVLADIARDEEAERTDSDADLSPEEEQALLDADESWNDETE